MSLPTVGNRRNANWHRPAIVNPFLILAFFFGNSLSDLAPAIIFEFVKTVNVAMMTVPKTVHRLRTHDSKSRRQRQHEQQQQQEQEQEQQHTLQPHSVDIGLTCRSATHDYHDILTSIAREQGSPIDGLDREFDKPDFSEPIDQNQTPTAVRSTSLQSGSEIALVTHPSHGETSSEQETSSGIGFAS